MQNLQNELIPLLKDEDNLVVDGNLNKTKIVEAVLKVEPELLRVLINSETFKRNFFLEVEGFYRLIGMSFYNKEIRKSDFKNKLISL